MSDLRSAAPLRRLLAVAVALVALVLGGLVSQSGARSPATAAGPSVSAITTTTRTIATRPAETRVAASQRGVVAQAHRDALVVQQSVDRSRHGGPGPVAVEPARPGMSAPLLLGQLARPPSTQLVRVDPMARRGRAPPAPAGT